MRDLRHTRIGTAVLAVGLLLTACSSGGTSSSSSASPSPSSSGLQRYVALGDSFSAGPLVPTTDLAGGCARSDHDYPSLVARALKVRLVDVTCSGATTRDLTQVQRPFGDARIPPQLRSVTPATDLVTLGIGGNDLDLFATLISTCTRLRSSDPTGSPCADRLAAKGPDLEGATATISSRVAASLRAIRQRAPRARILLVGYLRLVPDTGTCAKLPLATGDYAEGRLISRALDRSLSQAAKRTGVTFVDMYAASRGHDICSEQPWVNGSVTNRQRALAYHPFAVGMRADAARVLAALGQG
ncbi:MAG: SGNH/GDSL hydrolase family protein [Nocardioidaceae bacterium]